MMDRLGALLGPREVSVLKMVSEEEMKQGVSDAAPDCRPPLKSSEIIVIVGMLKEERLALRGNFIIVSIKEGLGIYGLQPDPSIRKNGKQKFNYDRKLPDVIPYLGISSIRKNGKQKYNPYGPKVIFFVYIF
jgi:hypothetical protein